MPRHQLHRIAFSESERDERTTASFLAWKESFLMRIEAHAFPAFRSDLKAVRANFKTNAHRSNASVPQREKIKTRTSSHMNTSSRTNVFVKLDQFREARVLINTGQRYSPVLTPSTARCIRGSRIRWISSFSSIKNQRISSVYLTATRSRNAPDQQGAAASGLGFHRPRSGRRDTWA
jgi:hypothetical protein